MNYNDALHTTVESREKERRRIEREIERFLEKGGEITKLETPLLATQHGPRKAMSSEIGIF